MRRLRNDRGAALLEVALTLPLVLLVSISIFEFGRAYQVMQVLTNAAREGARVAILPGQDPAAVQARVNTYVTLAQLPANSVSVTVTPTQVSVGGAATAPGARVTVSYPFSFMVLQPVARLVVRNTNVGNAFTMSAAAEMRIE